MVHDSTQQVPGYLLTLKKIQQQKKPQRGLIPDAIKCIISILKCIFMVVLIL